MPAPVSPAVELTSLCDVLRLYCHALTEQKIDVQGLKHLLEKNIGWFKSDLATTDGACIYLPETIARFETAKDNYDFLKVMVTQQAGHIEFGSFSFQFDRPATRFHDLRRNIRELPAYYDHDHGHVGTSERIPATDLSRFFRLFPSRRLASDIFSILEAGRVEAQVMREYPGIAGIYEAMRARELELRPEMTLLPAREALLELLTRLSLGQRQSLRVPAAWFAPAREVSGVLKLLVEPGSTVEDTAEATLWLYRCLAPITNDFCENNQFTVFRRIRHRGGDARHSLLVKRREDGIGPSSTALPLMAGHEREYASPRRVAYRGDFRPELTGLLSRPQPNSPEERRSLTAEELAELLRNGRVPRRDDADHDGEKDDSQISQMVQNLLREIDRRDPRMQSVSRKPSGRPEEDGEPLAATQPNTYVYDEWSFFENKFRKSWCKVHERIMLPGDVGFYNDTLLMHRDLLARIRNEFEQIIPKVHRKEKRLSDGVEHDLDAAIEALIDLRVAATPSEKLFWRQRKLDRDVVVAFLLDMSGSTGEVVSRVSDSAARALNASRTQKRIIDIEKEAIVLMCDALESIGDRYGVYGFSGHGRDNVEFYIIKDFGEVFGSETARRFGRIAPLHATRMGPAIRHTTVKLRQEQVGAKFLFLISDGRPQDRGYSQESSEKEYAIHDTRAALIEARREGIHPFCLTVDKEGNDYLRKMMGDFSYEVLTEVDLLPLRLPQLYRRLTM